MWITHGPALLLNSILAWLHMDGKWYWKPYIKLFFIEVIYLYYLIFSFLRYNKIRLNKLTRIILKEKLEWKENWELSNKSEFFFESTRQVYTKHIVVETIFLKKYYMGFNNIFVSCSVKKNVFVILVFRL